MKRVGRRYANLPIYAKILVPFAVLMIVWGAFGTAILAHGTATEARGRATAQLSATFDGARAVLADDEASLLETVRLAANTQGVADAVAKRDARALKEILVPLALNAGHDGLRVVDRTGAVILSLDTSQKPPAVLHEKRITLDAVLEAARGASDQQGDKFASLSDPDLLVAGPVRSAGGKTVGAVVVSDSIVDVAGRMGRGTGARIVIFAPNGTQLAATGGPLPYQSPSSSGLFTRVKVAGHAMEAIYGPLDIRGQRAGVVGAAFPSDVVLAGIGRKAAGLGIMVAIAVLVALGIGLRTARAVTGPIESLVDATRALQQGDLHVRAPEGSKDEIGTLAASFNAMAEELEASHRDLEQKVADRTAALEQANAQLVRQSSAKSAFLAMLSHELRTPLNGIIGFADMLSDPMFGDHSPEDTRHLASNIITSGQHLLGLINDLLDVAKIEAGRIEIRPASVRLATVLEEIQGQLEPQARAKSIKMTLDVGARVHKVLADPVRLRQVLINVVSNAIKFTPEGGRVSIRAMRRDAKVKIAVADTGPGIMPEEVDRVFQPYERGEAGRGQEGAGLGLSLARALIELQDGRLFVESVPGSGSTFFIEIPAIRIRAISPSVSEQIGG
jgi:signal transduction histidine kinase